MRLKVDDCFGNPCTENGACSDTGTNSYTCECDSGYTFNAVTCSEVFNCDTEEANDCDANAVCNHEGPGQHSCVCSQGYSGSGTECLDTDGCSEGPCFEGGCHDVPAEADTGGDAPTFTCDACPDGYSGDGETCSDVSGRGPVLLRPCRLLQQAPCCCLICL